MEIKKVPADTKDAVVFSVNNTDYLAKDGWASISLPPGIFEGKARVKVQFGKCSGFFVSRLPYFDLRCGAFYDKFSLSIGRYKLNNYISSTLKDERFCTMWPFLVTYCIVCSGFPLDTIVVSGVCNAIMHWVPEEEHIGGYVSSLIT